MPSSTKWRISITAQNGGSYNVIGELTMASSVGGANLCSGGTATANSEYSGTYAASKAFDGDTGTYWCTADATVPAWIQYEFASAQSIVYVSLREAYDGASLPQDFALQYYDGAAWQTVFSLTGQTGWQSGETRWYAGAAKVLWRFLFTDNSSNHVSNSYIEFAETQLRPSVGGSNAATDATRACANSQFGGNAATQLLDGNAATDWSSTNALPSWWQYAFTAVTNVVEYTLKASATAGTATSYSPKAFALQYYDGVSAWVPVDTQTSQTAWSAGEVRTLEAGVRQLATIGVG